MRVGFLSLALIVVTLAGAPSSSASATGIAFAQSQQPRNQAQSQEGLPPDQKKKISGFDPADVFGGSGEDPGNRQAARPQTRKPQPTPAVQSPPAQRQPAPSAAAPTAQASATPNQTSSPEPSPPVPAAALENGLQSPSLGQGNSSDKFLPKWAAPAGLMLMALIVSAALIFTLTKLVEKIREGSSG